MKAALAGLRIELLGILGRGLFQSPEDNFSVVENGLQSDRKIKSFCELIETFYEARERSTCIISFGHAFCLWFIDKSPKCA